MSSGTDKETKNVGGTGSAKKFPVPPTSSSSSSSSSTFLPSTTAPGSSSSSSSLTNPRRNSFTKNNNPSSSLVRYTVSPPPKLEFNDEMLNQRTNELKQQMDYFKQLVKETKIRHDFINMLKNEDPNHDHTLTITLNLSFNDLFQNSEYANETNESLTEDPNPTTTITGGGPPSLPSSFPFPLGAMNGNGTNGNSSSSSTIPRPDQILTIDQIKALNQQWKILQQHINLHGNTYNFFETFPQTAVEWVQEAERSYTFRQKNARRQRHNTGKTLPTTLTAATTKSRNLRSNGTDNDEELHRSQTVPSSTLSASRTNHNDDDENNDDDMEDENALNYTTSDDNYDSPFPTDIGGMNQDDLMDLPPVLYKQIYEIEKETEIKRQKSLLRSKSILSAGSNTNGSSPRSATPTIDNANIASSILQAKASILTTDEDASSTLLYALPIDDLTDPRYTELVNLELLRITTPTLWKDKRNRLAIPLPSSPQNLDQQYLELQIDRGKDYFMRDLRSGTIPQKLESTFAFRQNMDLYTNLTYDQIHTIELLMRDGSLKADNHPIFTLPARNRRVFEVDHIWDIQLIVSAVCEVWKHIPEAGFSPFQLRYIRLIINSEPNLNVTTHFLNMKAKRLLVQRFLERYSYRGDGNKNNSDTNSHDNSGTGAGNDNTDTNNPTAATFPPQSYTSPTKEISESAVGKTVTDFNNKTKLPRTTNKATASTTPVKTTFLNGREISELDKRGYNTKYLIQEFLPPSVLFSTPSPGSKARSMRTNDDASPVPLSDSSLSNNEDEGKETDCIDNNNGDKELLPNQILTAEPCFILDNIRDTMRRVLMSYLKLAFVSPHGVWRDFEKRSFRYLFEVLVDMCLVLWPEEEETVNDGGNVALWKNAAAVGTTTINNDNNVPRSFHSIPLPLSTTSSNASDTGTTMDNLAKQLEHLQLASKPLLSTTTMDNARVACSVTESKERDTNDAVHDDDDDENDDTEEEYTDDEDGEEDNHLPIENNDTPHDAADTPIDYENVVTPRITVTVEDNAASSTVGTGKNGTNAMTPKVRKTRIRINLDCRINFNGSFEDIEQECQRLVQDNQHLLQNTVEPTESSNVSLSMASSVVNNDASNTNEGIAKNTDEESKRDTSREPVVRGYIRELLQNQTNILKVLRLMNTIVTNTAYTPTKRLLQTLLAKESDSLVNVDFVLRWLRKRKYIIVGEVVKN